MELKNLNEIPVKCFRWLNVNSQTADIPFLLNKDFKKEYCKFETNDLYSITKYENILNIDENNALSDEFIGIVKNNYNAGFSIDIKDDANIVEPIIINYDLDLENNQLIDIAEITAGRNSKATIIIKYKKQENVDSSRLGFLNINLLENSDLKIIKVNTLENNLESLEVKQDKKSNLEFICVDFAEKINFINYNAMLNGADSKNSFETVYLGQNYDVLDFNFKIDHIGKNTKGFMDTRGILKDKCKKTMKATINFVRGSKSSKGSESEYVMILSPDVLNNSIPLLLCEEDDVSGEHASGIGRISESTMFYLCARGLSEEEAKRLLIMGYLNPIIDKINDDDIKSNIYKEIVKRTDIYE